MHSSLVLTISYGHLSKGYGRIPGSGLLPSIATRASMELHAKASRMGRMEHLQTVLDAS